MSLIKQLWLAIIGLLLLSFVGSLVISITTSRAYIEQEISIKNEDNATALALSMTQLDKDLVILELLISAQFDTGYYQQIVLRDTDGSVLVERVASEYQGHVPGWFRHLIDFDIPPGTATIQEGWQQFGTLTLQSQYSFAYRALWRSFMELTAWFIAAGIASLALAAVIVSTIKRPLNRVVEQARNISARRFTTIKEPRTRELREVARAMNVLSHNVRQMLTHESQKLDELRRDLQHDALTGALNRGAFMTRLAALLDSDDARATGLMAIVRVEDLVGLNDRLGHDATDNLLKGLVEQLTTLDTTSEETLIGRLNGSDFMLVVPLETDIEAFSARLKHALATLTPASELRLPTAITSYAPGDERSDLMATLDTALAEAESAQGSLPVVVRERERQPLFATHAAWRTALDTALLQGPELGRFPVLNAQQHVLHYESPARLQLAEQWQSAGVFIPWLARFNLEPSLDMAVIKQALEQLRQNPEQWLGINLSIAAISDARFVTGLRTLLEKNATLASRLCFEIPATLDSRALASMRGFCAALRHLDCQFGIEHVGAEFNKLAELHDVGLTYLKVDASLVRDIHASAEQQSILRGLTTLCHSLGLLVIAEGVKSEEELAQLFRMGIDGVTGPAIRTPN
ncbi:EAL domain-containing protein [Halomonas sp. PAMB 3232]|uniref:EAL domain-containing protein n=1 Tax=Halomonas sp. PAMB 3232 TaxID=3075221 RepID=UPI002899B1D9|nr:EAL domain-containing protein [Halomonas sp. PAMB 3232]WNL40105.1 EAL domain-containing protein [Halomonas sp. PAMB 3232]